MNAKTGKFPDKGWVIEGNCLKHNAKAGGGDIITKNKYEEFDFRFEWKVSKGANSGVKYFIIRDRGSLGHEYQVLDDENHPDGAKGANRQTAAFYDVLEPAKDIFHLNNFLCQRYFCRLQLDGGRSTEC